MVCNIPEGYAWIIGKLEFPAGVNVSVDEKFGVRISEIIAQEERIEFEKKNQTF